jgi:hypothetical protein
MKANICMTSICIAGLSSYGQTVIFKGQLLTNNNSVIKNYTVIINGTPATSNDAGAFTTPINSSARQVDIRTSDKNYVVAYPLNGRILLPKDPLLLTQIVLEGFRSNTQLSSYLTSFEKLKKAAEKGQAGTNTLQVKIDSLAANLKKLGYTNEDLRIARERKDGIDLFYPEISRDLQDYILQAQSLMVALKSISDYAFVKASALTLFATTQNGFNQAYQKLYNNYPTYSRKITDYWEDTSLASEFGSIADTLLYSIGKDKILPLNDIIKKINQYFQLPTKDKEKLKQEIQLQIAQQVPLITDRLNMIEPRVKQLLDHLRN